MKCNEEQIENILKNYIEKEYCDYAILIDGQWGSGKTFFIKNNIIPMIKNELNKKALYISTYGMKSTQEIDKKIYFEIINDNIPKKNGIDLIKKGGKVIISGANEYCKSYYLGHHKLIIVFILKSTRILKIMLIYGIIYIVDDFL